jgi:arginine decarboxylase
VRNRLEVLARTLAGVENDGETAFRPADRGVKLGAAIKSLRPELDLYMVTDMAAEDVASESTRVFRRIFYRQEDYLELHLNILRGIAKRYETPFFTALKEYARQPTGVFHADFARQVADAALDPGRSVCGANISWPRPATGRP